MKLLLLANCPPIPETAGHRQRTALLFESLKKHSDVDLIVISSKNDLSDEVVLDLRKNWNLIDFVAQEKDQGSRKFKRIVNGMLGIFNAKFGFFRKNETLVKCVEEALKYNSYDAIVTRYINTATYAGLPFLSSPPVYVDLDDYLVDWLNGIANCKNVNYVSRIKAKLQIYSVNNYLNFIIPKLSGIWLANPVNRNIPALKKAHILHNIPWCGRSSYAPSVSKSPVLLIVSSKNVGNMCGIDMFVREAWPLLNKICKNIRLRIAGGMNIEFIDKWKIIPGVEVVGFVQDLSVEYSMASLVVAPVAFGAGTNIKVLESFSHGRCCVMSPSAARGQALQAIPGSEALVAKSILGMADVIKMWLQNDTQRNELENKLFEWVNKNRNRDTFASETWKAFGL